MSSRIIRTIHDFARHRRDIELTYYCGHKAVLPYQHVVARFSREGWSISLDSAAGHFRCSKCGSSPRPSRTDGALNAECQPTIHCGRA